MELRRERDIEQLRRVAIAQEAQIHALVRTLKAKCVELATLKGNEHELQQTLALIEQLTQSLPTKTPSSKSDEHEEPADTARPKPRDRSGPTEQLALEHIEQLFVLDDADKTCPSCGGELRPMAGQFESSEMIDVVEVRYCVVQVKLHERQTPMEV